MTTIAFDGSMVASDSLSVDSCGLKDSIEKVWVGQNLIICGAGNSAHIFRWMRGLQHNLQIEDLIKDGYPSYADGSNDPAIMVVSRSTRKIWRHSQGEFIESWHQRFAIGSGRDFAIGAMECGASAFEAIKIASKYDAYTGGEISRHFVKQ